MKLCTVVWNPTCNPVRCRSKYDHPCPYFSPIFTAIMLFEWEVPNTTVTTAMDTLCSLIAQRMLLGNCYTPYVEKCYKPISFSHKPKTEFQYTSIDNTTIIQIIASCHRYCRLLLAASNCVAQLYLFSACC